MYRLILILTAVLAGCYNKEKEPTAIYRKFRLPVIIRQDINHSVKNFPTDYMQGIFPQLIGKFKFEDTINFTGERQFENQTEEEVIWERKDIFENDSLSSDGLQIIPDYKTSLAYRFFDTLKYLYYPVYVVNETLEPKVFFGKDGHGYAIQEALDTSNNILWYPIESQGYDFCGNGRFRKKINPGEYLIFLMPRYSGPLSTSLRIRFQIGPNTIISRSFPGLIDPHLFKIDKESWIHRRLEESKGASCSWLFFGGIPKEIKNYNSEYY